MSLNSPNPSTPPIWEKVGASTIIVAYAMLLGTAYLFSFWRPIGFDIFPYLSLSNYISLALNRIVFISILPLIIVTIIFSKPTILSNNPWRDISLYLTILFCVGFLAQLLEAIALFREHKFHYKNEIGILVMAFGFFLASITNSYVTYKQGSSNTLKIFSIVFAQISCIIAAGYCDGKTIFNGANNIFYLKNTELCEQNSKSYWIYLGKFSD